MGVKCTKDKLSRLKQMPALDKRVARKVFESSLASQGAADGFGVCFRPDVFVRCSLKYLFVASALVYLFATNSPSIE